MRPSLYPILSGDNLSSGLYRIYRPEDNTVISGGATVFNWTAGAEVVTAWWLYAFPTISATYHDSGELLPETLSRLVSDLPTSGTIQVTLFAQIDGLWQEKYYTYTGAA